MKIYCNLDLDARKFEGRTSLATSLIQFLEKQGYSFTKNPAEADLIHFHSSGIADSRTAYLLKKKYNIPCIYSLYSTAKTEPVMHLVNYYIQKRYFQKTATNFLWSYSAALPLRWRGYYLKKLDKVIVANFFLQQELFANTQVIPFGVDTERFIPCKKAKDRLKIGYFGHPGVFKGMNDFVQASKDFPEAEVHMFLSQRFAKVDKYINHHHKNIIIHGYTEDMAKAYNQMDIIVLPYRTQVGTVANPLVLLEAMGCGKAIVTTSLPFVKEIVQDAALVVPPYSPQNLAKAVHTLVSDASLRADLGKKARQRVVTQYNRQKMMEQYEKLYREFNHEN